MMMSGQCSSRQLSLLVPVIPCSYPSMRNVTRIQWLSECITFLLSNQFTSSVRVAPWPPPSGSSPPVPSQVGLSAECVLLLRCACDVSDVVDFLFVHHLFFHAPMNVRPHVHSGVGQHRLESLRLQRRVGVQRGLG